MHHDQQLGEEIQPTLERLKWWLWHGNLYKPLGKIEDIEALIYNFEESYPKFKALAKAETNSPNTPVPRACTTRLGMRSRSKRSSFVNSRPAVRFRPSAP